MYSYITFNVFKVNYVDNIQAMLQSNEIRGHAGVFIVNFTTRIHLIDILFSLIDRKEFT